MATNLIEMKEKMVDIIYAIENNSIIEL